MRYCENESSNIIHLPKPKHYQSLPSNLLEHLWYSCIHVKSHYSVIETTNLSNRSLIIEKWYIDTKEGNDGCNNRSELTCTGPKPNLSELNICIGVYNRQSNFLNT